MFPPQVLQLPANQPEEALHPRDEQLGGPHLPPVLLQRPGQHRHSIRTSNHPLCIRRQAHMISIVRRTNGYDGRSHFSGTLG